MITLKRIFALSICMDKNKILSGLAAIVVASSVAVGIEKSGMPQAQQDIEIARSTARWGQVPVAQEYFPTMAGYAGRMAFDVIPAVIAGAFVYYLVRKEK